jgi:hypothetical protein
MHFAKPTFARRERAMISAAALPSCIASHRKNKGVSEKARPFRDAARMVRMTPHAIGSVPVFNRFPIHGFRAENSSVMYESPSSE